MNKYYLRVEGVNISGFVDDTKDLNTIRGGGLILLDAIRAIDDEMGTTLRRIAVGASSGLFEFESDDPEAVAEKTRSYLLTSERVHATFVVDYVPANGEFEKEKELALAKNRFQQLRAPSFAIPSSKYETAKPCKENRLRPATERGRCASVLARHEYGKELKKEQFYKRLTGLDKKFTNDFEQIATDATRGNLNHKMAIIYLDGNKFGRIQAEKCGSPELLRGFDEKVQQLRKDMLRGLLEYIDDPERRNGWLNDKNPRNEENLRIETLLWGGDEIMWVVPAWQGWDTLRFFFEFSKDWEFVGADLTHSAGIVFCHHNAPIRRIKELAHDLAESAKDRKDPNGNYFAYEVLESFDHVGGKIDDYRLRRTPAAIVEDLRLESLLLSGANMAGIAEEFSAFADSLPRRRLYRIAEMLIAGTDVKAEIDELLKELNDADRKSLAEIAPLLNSPVDPAKDLKDELAANPAVWIHLNTLWDYLG
ncbi:MAG: hypothetical protein IPN69_01715 [Acidobacteria bacterium]|nr:hypothetical protein [Acidobacteriota bacterium]